MAKQYSAEFKREKTEIKRFEFIHTHRKTTGLRRYAKYFRYPEMDTMHGIIARKASEPSTMNYWL